MAFPFAASCCSGYDPITDIEPIARDLHNDGMSSFEKTLNRVLDPEGVYWTYAGEETLDPSAEHTVQLRIDVPPHHVATAVEAMERDGWSFIEQPDEPSDPQQRLFFQRRQNLLPGMKATMLTNALRVVFLIEGGRLWTWIIVEDESNA